MATRVNARIACAAPAPAELEAEEDTEFVGLPAESPNDETPPFDPPDVNDLMGPAFDDDDPAPPFDPPDLERESFCLGPAPPFDHGDEADGELLLGAANENKTVAPRAATLARTPAGEASALCRPVPSITIHASWDRPEIAGLVSSFAADKRIARAEVSTGRGGIDGAAMHFATHEAPDLLILDTTLRGKDMLAALDRLIAAVGDETRIIVLGAINDITLLRDLAARGVSEYVVPPLHCEDLVRSVCRLFADTDKARVIAVMGARGGVGASTIAHNLAWSIAERQDAGVTLLDLDLCFGTAATSLNQDEPPLITDLLDAPEKLEDPPASQSRLQLIAAPTALERDGALNAGNLVSLIAKARRISPYVILDLPHAWNAWMREALLTADDIVIVAGPDLASLRNADSIVKHLRVDRPDTGTPFIALSMLGVPKRPEIPLKDFTEAVGVKPIASFAFDPELFGHAAINGQMIGEAAPGSKTAAAFDALATLITGREPVKQKAPRRAPAVDDAPVLELTQPAEPRPDPIVESPQVESATPAPIAPFTFKRYESDEIANPIPLATVPITEASEETHDQLAAARLLQGELRAMHHPPRGARRRQPSSLLRAAAVATIIVAAAALYSQDRRETAEATEPQPPPVTVTPPSIDRSAQLQTAIELLNGAEARQGVNLLRRLAEDGFAPAQHRLAKLYENGQWVEADTDEAHLWTERAAAAGNTRAMHDLGVYASRGEASQRDDATAFRWFRQAAEFDVADSQYNLGILYLQGRGVSENAQEALFWFMLAARHGDEGAVARVGTLESRLTPMQVENARARAQAFSPRAPNAIANGAGEPR